MAFGAITPKQSIGSGPGLIDFSASVTGLQPDTTYYYRVVAENSKGRNQGANLTFTTAGAAVLPISSSGGVVLASVSAPTAITGISDMLALIPSVDNHNPKTGDVIEYALVYRNTSDVKKISNLKLEVKMPQGGEFVSSNVEPVSKNSGSKIKFNIGALSPNSQSLLTMKVKIGGDLKESEPLLFTARGDFLDEKGISYSITSVLSVTVAGGSFLASIFGSIRFSFGWFVFFSMILLLVYFMYRVLMGRRAAFA